MSRQKLYRLCYWLTNDTPFVFPLILLVFPVPLLFPIAIICMAKEKPHMWPLPIIYFALLFLNILAGIGHDKYLDYFRKLPRNPTKNIS